jgi:lysozyme
MKKLLVGLLWVFSILATIHVTEDYTHIEENLVAIAHSTLGHIIKEEGFKTKAYRDSQGNLTIGVGHLIKRSEPHLKTIELTHEQVIDLLREDMRGCGDAIDNTVKVPLRQGQFDALYSLCFNIGEHKFKKSTVVRKLNEGDYHGAADAILLWDHPPEIQKRRKRERALFLADS